MNDIIHTPVILNEVLQQANIKDNDVVVDCTFGAGGYSKAFLNHAKCTVYAIDRDPQAIERSEELQDLHKENFKILEGCFGNIKQLLLEQEIDKVDVIVLDLGVSSPQINQAERGFSFKKDGPLDMRMSNSGISAKDIVNKYSHGEIAHIIKNYGEEKMAGKISSRILKFREKKQIETTKELADIVRNVVFSKNSKIDPATRTFQGLRIAVNDELGEIERCLEDTLELLNSEGRLVVVSFHSLEDRIIKNFIKKHSQQESINRHLPINNEKKLSLKVGNKKFIKCTEQEYKTNPRSRSAKLRMATKI